MTSTELLTLPQGTPPELTKAIKEAAARVLDHHGLSAFGMPREAAIAHEAGHAIVGTHEGLTIRSVSIFNRSLSGVEAWGGHCTESAATWTTGPDTTSADDLRRARFIIAGLAGEAVTGTDKPGSSLDELALSQLLGLNAAAKLDDDPDRSDQAYDAYAQRLWHERVWEVAVAILRANRKPFFEIAQHLHEKQRMEGATLRQALTQVRGLYAMIMPGDVEKALALLQARHDKPNGADEQYPDRLVPIDLARYDTEKIPTREWGVLDRFPRLNVVLLSGHGGTGKSLLLLQLSVAHVLGKDWLRSLPEPGPVLLVNCEDDEGELVRRLQPILRHHGASYADIAPDLHIFPLVDCDDETGQLLATVGRDGIVRPTPLYEALLAKARKVLPICIVIDNVADVFGGDEINRSQVRQFVGLIRRLARAANGYVIMSAHPSVAGMANKSGLSGSTQWHNSVRARAYLRGADDKNDDAPTSDARVLEFMKSNYSALAEQLTLRWVSGLYLPAPTPSAPEAAASRAAADALFLELLDKHEREGANVSASPSANNYAPRLFAEMKEAKQAKIGKHAFADALSRLIETDRVVAETYGPPKRSAKKLVRRRPI